MTVHDNRFAVYANAHLFIGRLCKIYTAPIGMNEWYSVHVGFLRQVEVVNTDSHIKTLWFGPKEDKMGQSGIRITHGDQCKLEVFDTPEEVTFHLTGDIIDLSDAGKEYK